MANDLNVPLNYYASYAQVYETILTKYIFLKHEF